MPKINSFDDANKVLFEIAQCDTFIAKKEADMNNKINKLKEKFEAETIDQKSKKELLEKEVEAYCMLNKSEFQKERSRKLLFGEVGFRTTPPKVSQLNRKYSVKTTIELLKKLFSGLYLRTKEEVDKEMILKDYSTEVLTDDKLAAVGLKIDQEDKFSYEINWEALEPVKSEK